MPMPGDPSRPDDSLLGALERALADVHGLVVAGRVLARQFEADPARTIEGLTIVLNRDATAAESDVASATSLTAQQRFFLETARWLMRMSEVQTRELWSAQSITIARHPIVFWTAFVQSFIDLLEQQVTQLLAGIFDLARWLAAVQGCVSTSAVVTELIGLRETIDVSLPRCQPLAESVLRFTEFRDAVTRAATAASQTAEAVRENPDLLYELLGAFYAVAFELSEAMAGDTPYRDWLLAKASDAETLGRIWGAIHAIVLWAVLTEIILPLDLADAASGLGQLVGGDRSTPRSLRPTRAGNPLRLPFREMEDLIGVIRRLLKNAKKTLRLRARFNNVRFEILLRHLDELGNLDRHLARFEPEIAKAFRAKYRRIGRYGDLRQEVGEFNAGANAIQWLRILRDRRFRSFAGAEREYELVAETYAQRLNVFEAAHVIDQRFWNASPALRDLFGRPPFNWRSVNDMDAIIASSAEHTGSPYAYFKRLGVQLDVAELTELNQREMKSITEAFEDGIRLRSTVRGSPPEGVFVFDENNPDLRGLILKVDELWHAAAPRHANALEAEGVFRRYRQAVGLP